MKNIYCICGPSGVGKTTVSEYLAHRYNLKTVDSYTDRPKRAERETGHVFLTGAEFDALPELVAYTEYNGFRYGVTQEMVDQCDLYVIDPPGIRELKKKYSGVKGIKVIGLTASYEELYSRMKRRGDSVAMIVQRIRMDLDWFAKRNLGFSYDFCLHADGIQPTATAIWEFISYTEQNSPDVRLYQINRHYDADNVKFMGSEELRAKYGKGMPVCINASVYDEVWSGDVTFNALDEAYLFFNTETHPGPMDFHSLSISDILEIQHNPNQELNGKWFCDRFDWKKLKDDVYIPLDC